MFFTFLIIATTVIVSIRGFKKVDFKYKMAFYPYAINNRREFYRFFSYGFVHSNAEHLIVNMITLIFFAPTLEQIYASLGYGFAFPLLYFSAIPISVLADYFQNKNSYHYIAVGASGAVSAVVFNFIFFFPWETLRLFFVIPIKAIIFAVLYLAYSYHMAKRNMDNIGHLTHFVGSVYGFIFPLFINKNFWFLFLEQLKKF